jgi:Uma2 family endonuclease
LDLKKIPAPYAPDVAVEVLSPSELVLDLNHKVRDYLLAGSQEVWLLDPENGELHVRTKTGIRVLQGSEKLESPLLPGFSVGVEALLAGR